MRNWKNQLTCKIWQSRIKHRYPCYVNGGCIPYDGYFVQKLEEGFFTDKWIDIKGFGDKERAEELLEILKGE